jgi:hypothetical protein
LLPPPDGDYTPFIVVIFERTWFAILVLVGVEEGAEQTLVFYIAGSILCGCPLSTGPRFSL